LAHFAFVLALPLNVPTVLPVTKGLVAPQYLDVYRVALGVSCRATFVCDAFGGGDIYPRLTPSFRRPLSKIRDGLGLFGGCVGLCVVHGGFLHTPPFGLPCLT